MGNVTFGVPEDLTIDLKNALGCHVFIETGTYKGNTALWASKHFRDVYTVEINPDRYKKTVSRVSNMKDVGNIKFLNGNSKDMLTNILKDVNEPVIFWLDAHGLYAGQMTVEDEIPLMDELNTIFEWQKRTDQECVILIDDARLFTNPPPIDKGYHPELWPNTVDIDDVTFFHEMWIAKDVIVLYNSKYRQIVKDWSNK